APVNCFPRPPMSSWLTLNTPKLRLPSCPSLAPAVRRPYGHRRRCIRPPTSEIGAGVEELFVYEGAGKMQRGRQYTSLRARGHSGGVGGGSQRPAQFSYPL